MLVCAFPLACAFAANSLFLSNDTDGGTSSTSGLTVLTSALKSPEVSKTSVLSNLLHSLEILSDLGIKSVGGQLHVGTVSEVSLSVKEPHGETSTDGVTDDSDDVVGFFFIKVTSSSVGVDLSLLADEEGESSSDTSDGSQSEGHLSSSIKIGVQNSKNVLEFSNFLVDKAHFEGCLYM
eukprot:TRINITY_DN27993_c0_g1_i1.p1 TRINITY_DN27993_c0_g1~~TRINITY_DN27993_c0_g1_i1.p1  ORF type:complete len:179 (+),score=21.00 TRINITY_DN27993_c0_g1_i1:97-633(+)